MGLLSKKDPAIICSSCFKLIRGIYPWDTYPYLIIKADLYEDRIVFSHSPIGESEKTTLYLDKIKSLRDSTPKKIVKKDKNLIARYAVGSLLGPVGGMVGAVSGMGKNTKIKRENTYIITYELIAGVTEYGSIQLGTDCMFCNHYTFIQELRKRVSLHEFSEVKVKEFL